MRCTHCTSAFRFSTWILQCGECKEQFCTKCMKRTNGIYYCEKCVVLIARPPDIDELMKLKSKDLQEYLRRHNIPTLGLVEKRDLVELLCNKRIPVKNTRGSTVLNKIFSNFESVFLPDKNDSKNQQTSPTASQPSPRPRPPPMFPCTSTDNLRSAFNNFFQSDVGEERTPHTLPKESRPPSSRSSAASRTPPGSSEFAATTSFYAANVDAKSNVESSPTVKRYPKLSDYDNMEDLGSLSSKELKILLTINRVDYRGCVEKSELLEKVERLWHDAKKHNRQDLPENLDDLCKLCMDAPLDCVLLECGHIATCVDCGKKLAECPICRQYVSRVVRTFKA